MSCTSCMRKKTRVAQFFADSLAVSGNPNEWGPVFWNVLHILAERCGKGHPSVDADQARCFDFLITALPLVLPCAECSEHARTYIASRPFRCTGKVGVELSIYVRTWLLEFHNTVRLRQGKTIEIKTLEELAAHYEGDTITDEEIKLIVNNVTYGIRMSLVKMDNWKRWTTQFSKLRLFVGA
jgi:hypothetical protein